MANDLVKFDAVSAAIDTIGKKIAGRAFDYATPEGAKGARAAIRELRAVKTDVGLIHKEIKAEALQYGRMCDAKKNELNGRLDVFIEVHAGPLREIAEKAAALAAEKAERARVAEEDRLEKLRIREEQVEADAKALRDAAAAVAAEEQKVAAEAEAQRRAKEAREQAEERAERDRIAAAEKAERVKRAAVDAERERQRREKEADDALDAKLAEIEEARVQDEEHRKSIEDEVNEFFTELVGAAYGGEIVDALKAGNVPHTTINY